MTISIIMTSGPESGSCHPDRDTRIVDSSGGTSLEGHITAPYGGLCIDLSRMDKILELNRECSARSLFHIPSVCLFSAWGICAATLHGQTPTQTVYWEFGGHAISHHTTIHPPLCNCRLSSEREKLMLKLSFSLLTLLRSCSRGSFLALCRNAHFCSNLDLDLLNDLDSTGTMRSHHPRWILPVSFYFTSTPPFHIRLDLTMPTRSPTPPAHSRRLGHGRTIRCTLGRDQLAPRLPLPPAVFPLGPGPGGDDRRDDRDGV
jgi:hypothetical protein